MSNEDYIRECIRLAAETIEKGNPPFASILVHNGEVIATGANTVNTDGNLLRHGEMNLLENAFRTVEVEKLKESTVYAIGEPCPMCASAMYWAGIPKLVYGARRTALRDVRGFGLNMRPEDIYATGTRPFEVVGPTIEDEVVTLYEKFYEKQGMAT